VNITDLIVEVRDASLARVGQFTPGELASLLVVPRANSVGSWSIELPDRVLAEDGTESDHALCRLLRTPGYGLIVTDPTGVVLSGPMRTASHSANTADPGGTWTLTGVSDTTVIAESECWPQPGNSNPATQATANDVRTGPAETLLYAYFSANIGPAATPARRNLKLTVANSLGRGPVLTHSPRFQNMMELFQLITAGTNLLFDVVQVGGALQLRVTAANDMSASIRMDIENNQLESAHVEYSAPGVTHVTVLGQNEGTERTAIQRTSAASLAAAAQWGVRIERTIDQRNTDVVAELQQAGDDLLAEEGVTVTSMRVVPSGDQAERFVVGDYVTIVVGTQELVSQVTEKPFQGSVEGLFIGATVGDPAGFDWESLVNNRQDKVESRVSALERNIDAADPNALIVDPRLPARLRAHPVLITDWNTATENGWYLSYPGATNAPANDYLMGEVQTDSNGGYTIQTVTQYGLSLPADTFTWRRRRTTVNGSTWEPWYRLRLSDAEIRALVNGINADTGWMTWVPATNAITLGNGLLTGRYRKRGKTVECVMTFTLGTTSSIGTQPLFGLPFTAAVNGGPVASSVQLLDSGSYFYTGVANVLPTYTIPYWNEYVGTTRGVAWGAISATSPFTWANTDSLQVRLVYETSE
jgi:hypothetical protein